MDARFSRIIFTTLFISACLTSILLFSGFSIIESFFIGIFPWPFLLLFFSPISLLFTLLFIRPSLDRLSELVNFSLPFDSSRIITVAQLFGLLTVVLGILYLLPRMRLIIKTPLFSIFILLLTWGTSTLTYSINTSQTLYELLRLFSIFFIFLLSYWVINTQKKFFQLLIISALSAIIPLATALYQFIFNIGYVDDAFSVSRIYGTFAHPNIFALYLVVILGVLLLIFISHPKKTYKNTSLASFFGVLMIFIITYARTAWATFFLFLGSLTIIKYPRMLPVLIFVPLALFLVSPTIQDRITEGFNLTPGSSLTWRINIWNDTIHQTIIDHKILFGYGLNTFETIAENIRGIRFVVNAPHSEFVRSFVEGGLVGLAVFLIFSFAPLILLYKKWRTAKDFVAQDTFLLLFCLTGSLLLLSATDHVLRSTMVQWILWAMIGGALSIYGKEKKEKA